MIMAGVLKNRAKFILLWISLFCLQVVDVFISGNVRTWFSVLVVRLDDSTAYIELQLLQYQAIERADGSQPLLRIFWRV